MAKHTRHGTNQFFYHGLNLPLALLSVMLIVPLSIIILSWGMTCVLDTLQGNFSMVNLIGRVIASPP